MSQQKVLFTVCALTALVALVSGQNVNVQKCLSGAQDIFTKYISNFQLITQSYSDALTSSGNQAFDSSAFNTDVQTLVTQYTQLANLSGGINGQTILEKGYEIARTQLSLVTKYFLNPSLGLSAVGASVDVSSKLLQANGKLIQDLSSVCSVN